MLALIFEVNDSYEDNALVEPFAQAAASYASSTATDDVYINANLYENLNNVVTAFGTELKYYTYQGSLTVILFIIMNIRLLLAHKLLNGM